MLVVDGGLTKKLVCCHCELDNIGESGLGSKWVYCGHCMRDLPREACILVTVTDEKELAVLRQTVD